MRDFIGNEVYIDGRSIPFRLVTGYDYLLAKGWSEKKADAFLDNNDGAYTLLNQIMGLKQACFLLRHTSHSCQSLPDNLYSLKMRLIHELKEKYNFDFDDQFVNDCGMNQCSQSLASTPEQRFQDTVKQWLADQEEIKNSNNPMQTFADQLKRRRQQPTPLRGG